MNEQLKILLRPRTAVISDVCDSIGIAPPVLDNELFAFKGCGHGFAGPGESHKWTGGDHEKLATIDAMPPEVVAVWAGGNIQGVCLFR